MKLKLGLATTLVAALALTALIGMHALAGNGQTKFKADVLTGYQEAAAVGSVSTPATGTFEATVDEDAQTLSYTLTYVGLTTPATQAHIHFGNRVQNGGVVVFLCGGGPHPVTCPAGTTSEATVTGTVDASDVIGPAGQGIAAGEFGELVDALRAGVAYANVHSSTWPSGEVRGQINDGNQRQP
jgi:CHRD domain